MNNYTFTEEYYRLQNNSDFYLEINTENLSQYMLYKRGEYLTEVIDKQSKLNKEDLIRIINENKDNKFISIDYLPGSGKTTAYRQFITSMFFTDNGNNTGVMCLPRNEDVNLIYYDILSQCYYYCMNHKRKFNYKDFLNFVKYFIFKFTGSTESLTLNSIKEFSNFQWLITNHQHLLIDPPYLLYKYTDSSFHNRTTRKYLFIDEMPRSCYEIYSIEKLNQIKYATNLILKLNNFRKNNYLLPRDELLLETDYVMKPEINKSELESDLYDTLQDIAFNIEEYTNSKITKSDLSLLNNNDPEINNTKIDRIISPELHSEISTLLRANRIAYKCSLLSTKLKELSDEDTFSYFSIKDLLFDNIIILNGTSDLCFKNSKYIKLISTNENKFKDINNRLEIIKLELPEEINRNISFDSFKFIIETVVNKVSELNPNSKILLYTWMSVGKDKNGNRYNIIELDVDSGEKVLSSIFEFNHPENIKFTYFNSGDEKLTSKFTECDILINIGSFFYPNSHLSNYNKVYESECSQNDLNLDLKVQALFRTSLRLKNNSVVKYYTNTLDDIDKYLGYTKNIEVIDMKEEISNLEFDKVERDRDISDKLKSYRKEFCDFLAPKFFNNTEIFLTSSELNEFFKYNSNDINRDIKSKLDRMRIKYKFEGSELGGKGNKRYYIFNIDDIKK